MWHGTFHFIDKTCTSTAKDHPGKLIAQIFQRVLHKVCIHSPMFPACRSQHVARHYFVTVNAKTPRLLIGTGMQSICSQEQVPVRIRSVQCSQVCSHIGDIDSCATTFAVWQLQFFQQRPILIMLLQGKLCCSLHGCPGGVVRQTIVSYVCNDSSQSTLGNIWAFPPQGF